MFRYDQMNKLQKTHTWRPAKPEGMYGSFNRHQASHGRKNADLFVSYLGYLRDTAFKSSQKNFNKEVEIFE